MLDRKLKILFDISIPKAFQRLDRMNNWFDLTILTIFRSNNKTLVDNKSESAVLIISIVSYDQLIWNSLIYIWLLVYTKFASLLLLQMQSKRYYIKCIWSMLIIRKINAIILINQSVFLYDHSVFLHDQSVFLHDQSVFLYDQSVFCIINQKMVRHTENFWGSGSYSKTVRPNGFFIYRW